MAWDRKKLIAYASGIPTPDFVSYLNGLGGGGGGGVSVGALIAGAGLSGGGDLNVGDVTLALGNTGVTAGSYGSTTKIPEITVDVHGRVTAVAEHTAVLDLPDVMTSGTYGGSLKDLTLVIDAKGRIVDIGVSDFTPENTGVVAGSYGSSTKIPTFTVDSKGVIYEASEQDVVIPDTGVTAGSYGSSTKVPHITIGTDGRITNVSEQDVTASLADSGVVAGAYGTATKTPRLTIDSKGRITSVSEVGTTPTLADTGIAAGTYGDSTHIPRLTLDTKGRVTAVSQQVVSVSLADSGVVAGSYGSSTKIPTFSVDSKGRITGVTEQSVVATLGNNGVTAGTYGTSSKVPQITVDSTGRVTNVAEVSITGGSGTTRPWYWNPPSTTLLSSFTYSATYDVNAYNDSNCGLILNSTNLLNGSGCAVGKVGTLLTAATSFLIEAHINGFTPYTNSTTAANVLCAGILIGDDAGHWVCFGVLSKGGFGIYKATMGTSPSMSLDTEEATIPVFPSDDVHLIVNRRTNSGDVFFGFSKSGSPLSYDTANNTNTGIKYGSMIGSARTVAALGLTGNITKVGIGYIKNTGINYIRELSCDKLNVTQPYA